MEKGPRGQEMVGGDRKFLKSRFAGNLDKEMI